MPGSRERLVTPTFVLIAMATLAYFVSVSVVLPVLPLYVRGPLGGGDVAVGVTVGAFSVTALLVRPWAGRLADRRGRRLPMLLGIGIVTVSVAAYVAASSVPALVGLRLVTGAGEALFFTGAASAIADLAPDDRRGEAISFFSLALWTGIAIGPVVGEVVLGEAGYDRVWLVAASLGLLALLLTLRVRVPPVSPESGPSRLIHRGALLPGTAVLASIWGAAGFFAFVPLYARELGLSGSRGVFVVFSVIVLAIRFAGARLPDTMGPMRAARLSLVVSATGLAVMGVWPTTSGLFAATAVYAVGQALAFPALMSLALRGTSRGERGAAIATFTAMVDVGFGIGPAALGFVAHGFGYGGVFLIGAAVAVLGFVLLLTRPRSPEAA
jgi:MFS family permease